MGRPHQVGATGSCQPVNVGPVRIAARSPAKLNLGLEILGPRADGFHDLVTIFTTIDLCDSMTFDVLDGPELVCAIPGVVPGENLVIRALAELRTAVGLTSGMAVTIEKRIPVAAGLGGASSNAATALVTAQAMWDVRLDRSELDRIALRLGSDVPFFLHGGAAIATGRGHQLDALELPSDLRFVLVSPRLIIPRKTSTLFASLQPGDFSDGERLGEQADLLRSGRPLNTELLANAFTRPLYHLQPELAELPEIILSAGAPNVALSGAGPTHYTVLGDVERARHIAHELRARLGTRTDIIVAVPLRTRYHDG